MLVDCKRRKHETFSPFSKMLRVFHCIHLHLSIDEFEIHSIALRLARSNQHFVHKHRELGCIDLTLLGKLFELRQHFVLPYMVGRMIKN